MTLRFPSPGPALSQNESNRQQWFVRNRYLHAWRDTTDFMARANRLGSLPPSEVTVHIPFAVNRQRDPHNYTGTVVKSVVDGLVRAGCWPDDNPKFVRVAEPVLTIGNDVAVEIRPL